MTSLPVGGGTASGGWIKSSFSNGQCACVEVRQEQASVLIRDSKYLWDPLNDPAAQPVITVSAHEFEQWVSACTSGRLPFATETLLTSETPDRGATVCHQPTGTCLTYTPAEWSAWKAGVEANSFVTV